MIYEKRVYEKRSASRDIAFAAVTGWMATFGRGNERDGNFLDTSSSRGLTSRRCFLEFPADVNSFALRDANGGGQNFQECPL